jgi:tRNA dimethylallyltransferase
VRRLLDQGYSPTLGPLRSLGYKEMIAYLCGEIERTTAIVKIKQETRRFAKRQLTWFRADQNLTWLDVSAQDSAAVTERLLAHLRNQGVL